MYLGIAKVPGINVAIIFIKLILFYMGYQLLHNESEDFPLASIIITESNFHPMS